MNVRTQIAFFKRKNPITIGRQFENNNKPRSIPPHKKNKNNILINYSNISTKVLDIPDILSHSVEKDKKFKILPYDKILKKKQNINQDKNFNNKIKNKRELFNFSINNNNFSLSNINYYTINRNKKNNLNDLITIYEKNKIIKDIKKNYQIKNININNNNSNMSTSLPKIKIKRNPIQINTRDNEKEKEKEKEITKLTKEKRAISQKIINYNIKNNNNIKSKIILKLNEINNKEILLEDILNEHYSFYQPAKHSENSFDKIMSYGVNTYKGAIRQYNEDRVTILINANINKNNINNNLLKISLFSIYDGHGGHKCSEYLKTYLHHYIFDSEFFPQNPIKAIEQGFKNCENNFLNSIHLQKQILDSSGSCAIIVLIINDSCYIINLGDSRALYSFDDGQKFFQLSRDHKPNDPVEKRRIYKEGGSIYKTNLQQISENSMIGFKSKESLSDLPYRIFPGRLSVSYILILQVARAFGDIESKIKTYGGNPNVLIAKPCITFFKITKKSDFIIMGCNETYIFIYNNIFYLQAMEYMII